MRGCGFRPKVLIVDDHEGFRSIARALLDADGFDVVGEAADGAAAIGSDVREVQELAYEVVLSVTAVGITVDLMWGGWSRAAVTGLVVELGRRAEAGILRDRLARALGDPSLVVRYSVMDSDLVVDEPVRSNEVPEPGSGRIVTPVGLPGTPTAVIIHNPAVLGDPALVVAVASATSVAVANARLQADIQQRAGELVLLRRRIVQAGDVQRHRLERELSAGWPRTSSIAVHG